MAKILFLSTRNACRSQMAEGFARARREEELEVASAGLTASGRHPMTIRVMAELGVDVSANQPRTLAETGTHPFDAVITLSDEAARQFPSLPGHPVRVDWDVSDPDTGTANEATTLRSFRECRDVIRALVNDLFDRGYLTALCECKRCADLILDNVSEGIIAHDMRRRIFCFNTAAERITGYNAGEVIGRDCQEVFPGGLCGGKCQFRGPEEPDFEVLSHQVQIVRKDGEQRLMEMSLRTMRDRSGAGIGVIGSFRDVTREHDLARRLGDIQQFSGIIGRDAKMLAVFDLIRDVADSNVPVLIQGDSGTGKELVAAAIHNESRRSQKLFVPVNCGALPESLLESELFGHVKGAFTGAIRDKKGRFELADGGTIFLDEIGDISPPMQVKLLRVLQEGKFERVGGERTLQVDARVISATNKDLGREIAEGRFREDLFYRLSVVPIVMPPLRERRNDIPILAEHILERMLKDSNRPKVTISDEVMDIMLSYDWPGNVRELENWLQFALVKCKDEMIMPQHLPVMTGLRRAPSPSGRQRRRKLDRQSVRRALRETAGNRVEAARILGVSRATLYRFLNETQER